MKYTVLMENFVFDFCDFFRNITLAYNKTCCSMVQKNPAFLRNLLPQISGRRVFYSAPTGLLLWLIYKIIVLVATNALQKRIYSECQFLKGTGPIDWSPASLPTY
jgi:hypothetical protein